MASLLDFFRNIPGFLLNGLTDEVMVPGADPDNIQFPFDNQRKQRVPSKFANVLGEALRRGAVAASTPSIAGGGGFDILRSMVAADDDSMKRQQFGQSMQNGQLDRMLRMQQLQNEALWRQSQMENFRQQSEDRDLERERKAKEDEQTALTRQQGEQNKFLGDGGFFLNNAQAPRDYNIPVTPWMLTPKEQATLVPSAPYDPKGSVRMQQTPGFLAGEKQRGKEKAERESWMAFPADVPEAGVKKGDKVSHQVYGQLLQFLKSKPEGNPTEASLALRAASGDKDAAKALELIRQNRIAGRASNTVYASLQGLSQNNPAIDRLVNQVYENPDQIAELNKMFGKSPELRQKFYDAWTAKTELPVPVPLNQTTRREEVLTQSALNHVDQIRKLLRDPQIAASVGPIVGRWKEKEQSWGAPLFASGEQARKEQQLRTAMGYLLARETKALAGGRPSDALREMLSQISARPDMGLPFILGALDSAAWSLQANMKSADQARFGGKWRKNKFEEEWGGKQPGAPQESKPGGGKSILADFEEWKKRQGK